MNYRYINNLNIKSNCMPNNIFSFFKRKPKVIQIGVGGAPSCGKTVLIDAIFAILEKGQDLYPGYIPGTFVNGKKISVANDIFDNNYDNYGELRRTVSRKFHSADIEDSKTEDDGTWNCNTHWIELRANKRCILLIRNLPGEMFNLYYKVGDFNANHNVDWYFKQFIGNSQKHKHFFDYSAYGNKTNSEIASFKEEFENHLKAVNPTYNNYGFLMKNFYAYLFYKTSDTVIKCVKSTKRNEKENEINIGMFNHADTVKNDYFCMTQIDRILQKKESIDLPREDFDKYANTMNKIYAEVDNREETFIHIDRDEWMNNRGIATGSKLPYFTSVTYNLEAIPRGFFSFNNDKENSLPLWTEGNSYLRTSIGVIELVLSILKRHNIKIKGLPNVEDKYRNFSDRMC